MSKKKIGSSTFQSNDDSARLQIEEAIQKLESSSDNPPDVTVLSDLSIRAAHQLSERWLDLSSDLRSNIVQQLKNDSHSIERNYDRALLGAIRVEPASSIRSGLLDALTHSEDLFLLDYLLDSAQQESSPRNRLATVQLLGNFALLAEYGEIDRDRAHRVATLLNDIHATDTDFSVRLEALVSVAYISDEPAIWILIEQMTETDDEDYLIAAARAMGHQADDRWIPHISELLAHDEPEVQIEAVTAAARVQSDRLVPTLIAVIEADTDQEIVVRAIDALGQIGSAEAIRYLESISRSEVPAHRKAANQAIEEHEQLNYDHLATI